MATVCRLLEDIFLFQRAFCCLNGCMYQLVHFSNPTVKPFFFSCLALLIIIVASRTQLKDSVEFRSELTIPLQILNASEIGYLAKNVKSVASHFNQALINSFFGGNWNLVCVVSLSPPVYGNLPSDCCRLGFSILLLEAFCPRR